MRNGRAAAVAVLCAVVCAVAGCTSDPTTTPIPTTTAASTAATATRTTTSATTTTPTSPARGANNVLALGDSITAGYQPGAGDDKDGGYVGRVLDAWRRTSPDAQLSNLACSGETTTSMRGGGRCRYPQGSQLAAAVSSLEQGRTGLVLLSIGANDVLDCARTSVDTVCAAAATTRVATNLTDILGRLRAAAPRARIVVLTYYDPLVASWRFGAEGQRFAAASLRATTALNDTIAATAATVGARVADIAEAFSSADTSGTPTPVNVTRVCEWTWMCVLADIHPNARGYGMISGWVISQL